MGSKRREIPASTGMTLTVCLARLESPAFPATALRMDVHPLIDHQPDPDYPGWWTWERRPTTASTR